MFRQIFFDCNGFWDRTAGGELLLPSEPPAHHRTLHRQYMLTILLVFAFTSEMKRERRKKSTGKRRKMERRKGTRRERGIREENKHDVMGGDRNQRRSKPVVTQRTVSIITAIFSRRTPKGG